jgi:hypothetical protein
MYRSGSGMKKVRNTGCSTDTGTGFVFCTCPEKLLPVFLQDIKCAGSDIKNVPNVRD